MVSIPVSTEEKGLISFVFDYQVLYQAYFFPYVFKASEGDW